MEKCLFFQDFVVTLQPLRKKTTKKKNINNQ